jgi:hypothetical protein
VIFINAPLRCVRCIQGQRKGRVEQAQIMPNFLSLTERLRFPHASVELSNENNQTDHVVM